MPIVPTSDLVLCEKEGELGSVLVVAEDLDQSPYSSPFTFSLPGGHDDKWSVTKFNGMSLYSYLFLCQRVSFKQNKKITVVLFQRSSLIGQLNTFVLHQLYNVAC